MSHTADTLKAGFGMSDYLVPFVLEELTDEDACCRARGDEGPSIAWAVGHLLHYRLRLMGTLGGGERDNPFAEQFATADATDGAGYPTVAELREHWARIAKDFGSLLASKTDADFDVESAGSMWKTLRDEVAFFAWHEAYHVGAMGSQVKSMGYPGPVDRARAARQKG